MASTVFRGRTGVPLILLNPPFTCRGARTEQVSFGTMQVNCSVALAFVLTAVSYMTEDGQLVAVLPQGSLRSSKDATGWGLLRSLFDVEIHQNLHCRAFSGAVVHTSVVSFKKRARATLKLAKRTTNNSGASAAPAVEIIRGKIQLHNARLVRSGVPLIHSTELRDGRVQITSRHVASSTRSTIRGPAVLLPRVGTPCKQKVAVLSSSVEIALSDCVIALRCATDHHAEDVAALLRGDRWTDVAALYGGTCARYVRVAVLQDWLTGNGIKTEEFGPISVPISSTAAIDERAASPLFSASAMAHRAGSTERPHAIRRYR